MVYETPGHMENRVHPDQTASYGTYGAIESESTLLLRHCCNVMLFYVHGKHLRSCRDGQLT